MFVAALQSPRLPGVITGLCRFVDETIVARGVNSDVAVGVLVIDGESSLLTGGRYTSVQKCKSFTLYEGFNISSLLTYCSFLYLTLDESKYAHKHGASSSALFWALS